MTEYLAWLVKTKVLSVKFGKDRRSLGFLQARCPIWPAS